MPKFRTSIFDHVEYVYEIEADSSEEAENAISKLHEDHSGRMAQEISVVDSDMWDAEEIENA